MLGERSGVGELGVLGGELRQQLVFLWCTPLRPSREQPGRPTCREVAVRRLHHDRQRLPRPPAPRGLTLRLAHALGVAGNRGITVRIVMLLELSEEAQGVAAAGIPARQDIGVVRGQGTVATISTALAQGRRTQVAKHRILANSQLSGNGPSGPSLVM
jgi:hypothetical protein